MLTVKMLFLDFEVRRPSNQLPKTLQLDPASLPRPLAP